MPNRDASFTVTSSVKSTPPLLIVTSPEFTLKLAVLNLAIPLLDVVASSPETSTAPVL